MTDRFRMSRAGVLNVWQYDEQIFEFAGGRLLLRGSNGAGKSKTLEMLLPFVLDGNKARMTASARHHTSLLWLMLDGYSGQNRAGYLWVEFARTDGGGPRETITCGVGIRASQSARAATAWFFTYPGRVGEDLSLEDDAGPLAKDRLRAVVEPVGHVFDSAHAYKQHVGRLLFGLEPAQYDELLRLLYWLRQPQVGEDIEPARLAEQLVQALPQLDDDAVRAAGDTFDELAAFGEQLDRQRRSAEAVAAFAGVYADYARDVLRARGAELVEHHRERTRRSGEVDRCTARATALTAERESAEAESGTVAGERAALAARLVELRADPLLRTQRELVNRRELAGELAHAAGAAATAAERARQRVERSGERLRRDAGALCSDLAGYGTAAGVRAVELGRAGARVALPVSPALHEPRLEHAAEAHVAAESLVQHEAAVRAVRPVLGELRAAVQVVETARYELDVAAELRHRAEQQAAAAEQRAEEERGHLADARRGAEQAEAGWSAAFDAWRDDPRAIAFAAPEELSAATVPAVDGLARAAAAPVLAVRRDEEKDAGVRRAAAQRDLGAAQRRREQVAAERDPAPSEPAWGRDARDSADGAAFWQLVDFSETLGSDDRAGIEAALESSGLLDAWVRADGAVLAADRRDVVLAAGPPAAGGPTLAEVLVADPPPDAPVAVEVVRGVLARISLGTGSPAAVDTDGSWRLGPLTGRSAKPVAQYIGATARSAERSRRLAELDELIMVTTVIRDDAAIAEEWARTAAAAVEAWLVAAPPIGDLVQAWARLDERVRIADRADVLAATAEAEAVQARGAEAGHRRALADLAAAHGLPTEAVQLAARRESLRDLDASLSAHADAAAPLMARLRRWATDTAAWEEDLAEAQEAAGVAVDELEQTVGAPLREIQRRISVAEVEEAALKNREGELGRRIAVLLAEGGAAGQAATDAAARLAEHEPVLAGAVAALGALVETPGLLHSGAEGVNVDPGVFDLAAGFVAGHPVPAVVLTQARRLAELPVPTRPGSDTAVYTAWRDAASGPAGDVDPRVAEIGGALTVIGRDDAGEHPIGELAGRLAAAVARDAELLTDRERRLFEEHILGDLGESLRARRLESEELVTEMNLLLRDVTTSQGIQVQLRWNLRDDVAADARRAVELLGRPVGALLPDERRDLRDALHRLIEASRADAPEDSYSEHLARALDYRRWFAFRIRYTRPENPDTWSDLHRRSPLSQGEQKVVCYLPLFAAAAAHFSSLAGAAPYSPRFVLLDDAFPKIDVRTHPLLFGLLVQLDLDFVVTSERLWGDHATVPSLAIYEALRDPNERGIAQYRHTWDGHQLRAVGS
jgi:uncharacterized protein (TIGR02680 family)